MISLLTLVPVEYIRWCSISSIAVGRYRSEIGRDWHIFPPRLYLPKSVHDAVHKGGQGNHLEPGPQDNQHTGEADQDRRPPAGADNLAEKDHRQDRGEDRHGEIERRRLGDRHVAVPP